MEAALEVLAAEGPPPPFRNNNINNNSNNIIAKGKRTKRHRPHSPIPFTVTNHHHLRRSPTATTTSSSSSDESTTTDEVDTARCLILLSRGYFSNENHHHPPPKHSGAAVHGGAGKSSGGGACVYTCKTCNRSFPSFQALGGHRASHKKPKNEKKTASIAAAAVVFSDEEDFPSPSMSSSRNRFSAVNSLSLQLSNVSTTTFSKPSAPSPRVHECSYCGAEFASGQALGGHMRKHRAGPIARSPDVAPSVEEAEPEGSRRAGNFGLSLDLNLPAPEDEKEKSPKEMMMSQRFRPGPGFVHHYYSTID